jgi:phage shock protein E
MMKKFLLPVILLLFVTITTQGQTIINQINSQEAYTLLQKNKKIVVLDVRTPGEFSQGHIANAINIDINQPDAIEKINKLDKNSSYLVYCRTKNRSGTVANYMVQNGFATVYQMMDGITGWNMNSLPVVN